MTYCPVCDLKQVSAEAIKQHNILAARFGCRRYPTKRN